MIDRLQLLRNIGQFDSVDAGADIALARLSLVYSENGRGKTTLAAVLRSLATGDPLPIAERRRLAAQHPPHVVLECIGGPPPAIFENNAWNRTLPDLVVFDDVFVDQNVHSGLAVQAQHRQNLHELILGAPAVTLNRRRQELVERIEGHNRELRAKEQAIPAANRASFSVDDFCGLPERSDIDPAIQEAERALATARDREAIRTTPSLELLSLPEFGLTEIEQVLYQDLDTLDADASARVQAHLATLGSGGEAWVADGVSRIPQENAEGDEGPCPFCEQNLSGSPIIQHYRAYFSDAYGALKLEVAATLEAVDRTHGRDVPAGFERAVRVTGERLQFWSRFCETPTVTLDTAAIVRDWRAAREAVCSLLAAKQGAPLERTEVSDETRTLLEAYDVYRAEIVTISQSLEETNQAIAVAKERATQDASLALDADLTRLKAIKARHTPETALLCEQYLAERDAKAETERLRDETRTELEQHRATVFPGYQEAINLYLSRFNADFRLDSVTYANTRGGPTCTYIVLINNAPVTVGGADAEPGAPSFGNTLSAGDRSTLALAFFFASLDQDPRLEDKIVVIDDPISSLDDHRVLATVQEIRRLSERTAQVIVLSHSKPFLCKLWTRADSAERAALEVVRDGEGSTLRAWDVTQDLITEHDRRHTALHAFMTNGTGDSREVARSIRPHLEAYLRVARPAHFAPGSLLGPFIGLCDQRIGTADAEEILDPTSIQELRDLNEFASRYHHQGWETEPVNDSELRGFVGRALTFCRGA